MSFDSSNNFNSYRSSDPFHEREKEKYSQPISSREYILDQLKEVNLPLKFSEIANLLCITEEHDKISLKHRLSAMMRDNQIERNQHQQFFIARNNPMFEGTVIAHKEGFGFLKTEGSEKHLFISPRQMRKVLHGDTVTAKQLGETSGRIEVKILSILTKRDPKFIGICRKIDQEWRIIPYIPSLLPNFLIEKEITSEKEAALLDDQLVVAEIIERASFKTLGIAKILKSFGKSHTQGIETEVAIQGHGLPVHWPLAVVREVELILEHQKEIFDDPALDRIDLRTLGFVTIDGEDSKDFDDAVYCEKTDNGWKLYVAIADVSHYVKNGSAIDIEAKKRGTSVYFPKEVIPMLPSVLSENLCSLLPQRDRLAFVSEMLISDTGDCLEFSFYPAKICSKARLTYSQVSCALESNQEINPLIQAHPCLLHLLDLLKSRTKKRETRGAIDLTIEANALVFSESGEIEAICSQKRNVAQWLIEEAMILANISAAQQMLSFRTPGLYRTHLPPMLSRLEKLRHIWQELGVAFPKKITRHKSIVEILKSAQEHPESSILQILVLRTLQTATYEIKNVGHFGLALKAYTHFTSPIRRYPDLIVHRILKNALVQSSKDCSVKKRRRAIYSREELHLLAQHCSFTERRADYASRDVLEWLKTNLAEKYVGQELLGIVSGFNPQNMFVKIPSLGVDGCIDLKNFSDFSKLKLNCQKFFSAQGSFNLGQEIKVKILRADPIERLISLSFISFCKQK